MTPATPLADAAMDAAVRLLTVRNHTRKELFHKLRLRRLSTEAVLSALDKCAEMGYLDDEKTARSYARELSQKGYGPARIRIAMRKRGLEERVVDQALEQQDAIGSELDTAEKVLKKKLATMTSEPDGRKKQAKLYRFLYSRGFSPPVISELLRRQ